MASTASCRLSRRVCFSSDVAEVASFRRSNRKCLQPLPARSVPPHIQDKYVTLHSSASPQCRAAPSDPDSNSTPYLDALIRCFLLGVVSGGLFESYGALSTLWGMSAQTANVWSMAKAAYPPQFVVDHIIGVCVLSILYAFECFGFRQASISSQRSLASFMAALPKALIPVKFTALKSQLTMNPDVESNTSSATDTMESRSEAQRDGELPSASVHAFASGSGTGTDVESPFVPDRAARPGLAPGQWDPALGGAAQDEAAKRSYLEGMYYCIGTVPKSGLRNDKIYDAYVMGTRVAYWKSADGKVNTISSTCTHRGAQLANGWIDTIDGQTCVRCPYHAWAFRGDGTVKDIPVQPEGGYPKRPLQQSFETFIEGNKMWMFWGRPQIPIEERPPVPGSGSDALVGMVSTTSSASLEAPHHNTMEVLASEKTLASCARTLFGILDCKIQAESEVEETWASRTVTYFLTPLQSRFSPLIPSGLQSGVKVTVTAQLPSSLVMSFQVSEEQCLRLEAHVLPETYSTSRLTITAHHNFAAWAATGPFVRDMLATISEEVHCQAEKKPLKQLSEMPPFSVGKNTETLLSAFTKLRVEFNNLGFGVPDDIAAAPYRVDM